MDVNAVSIIIQSVGSPRNPGQLQLSTWGSSQYFSPLNPSSPGPDLPSPRFRFLQGSHFSRVLLDPWSSAPLLAPLPSLLFLPPLSLSSAPPLMAQFCLDPSRFLWLYSHIYSETLLQASSSLNINFT